MRIPIRSLATLVLAIGVATCSDGPTGPGRPTTGATPSTGIRGSLAFSPVFSQSAAQIATHLADFGIVFDRVRVVIVRPPADTVKDTTVVFRPGEPDKTLDLTVDVRSPTEAFNGAIDYANATGLVYHGDLKDLHAHAPNEAAPPQTVVINYVGPGSNVARISVLPKTATLVAPSTQTFSVSAFDASNNAIPVVPVSWSTSDATIATITAAGVLQPTGKRGSVTVTATTPAAITDVATVTISAPPTSMTLVSGGGQTGKVGTALAAPVVVKVLALDGFAVSGATVNFVAPTGGSVSPSSAVTDGNGNASTNVTLGTVVGAQGFAATSGALSVPILETATAGDAAAITVASGSGQIDTLKRALKAPLVAKVADSFGNPVPGVTVTWTKTAGAGTLGAATSTSGADGLASVGYTLGTIAGAEAVTASIAGVTGTATFTITAVGSLPGAIAVVSGNTQGNTVGTAIASPMVVKVTDLAGAALPGATVTWSTTAGALGAATTTTDAAGTTSNSLTFGLVAGAVTVTASVDATHSAVFSEFASAGPPASIVWTVQPSSVVAGAAIAPALQLTLFDANKNATTSVTTAVTVALSGGTAGAVLSGTLTKNTVAGVATFSDLKIDRVGSDYTLVASAAGITTPLSSAAFAVAVGGSQTATQLLLVPATPTSITLTAGAAPTTPIALKTVDVNGVAVAGVPVTIVLARAGGTQNILTQGTSNTDANGLVSDVTAIIGSLPTTAGAYIITAKSASIPGATVSLTVTVQPAAASKLGIVVQPADAATSGAALPRQPIVQVQDAFGNATTPATTGALQVTATPSAGTASGNVVIAGPTTGTATFSALALTGTGSPTVVFSATGLTSVASTPVSLGNTSPTQLLLDPPTPTSFTFVAGVTPTSPPILKVLDAGNAPVSGVPVRIVITRGPITALVTVTDVTLNSDANGHVTFLGSLPTLATTYTATATSTSIPGTTVSLAVTVQPAAASKLGIVVQPADAATSGAALPRQPIVQVQDAFGNATTPATPGALQVTATPSAGTASGNVVSTGATTGTATFSSLVLTGTGSPTVVFSASGLTSVTSTPVSLAAATPTQLLLDPATPTSFTYVAGVTPTSTPTLKVLDAGNAPVSGVPVRIVVTRGPITALVTVTDVTLNSDANGHVTFLGSLPTLATTYTATATSTSISGAVITATVIIQPATASKLAFTVPTSTVGYTGSAGTAITNPAVVVTALDQFDNTATSFNSSVSVIITPSTNTNSATILNNSVQAISGIATFSAISINRSGTGYTLTAAGSGVTSAISLPVAISSGSVGSIAFAQLPSTTGVAGSALASQPTIQLKDGNGNNVSLSGVVITATVADAPGGPYDVTANSVLTFTSNSTATVSATTDANGLATFTNFGLKGEIRPGLITYHVSSGTSATPADITSTVALTHAAVSVASNNSGAIVSTSTGVPLATGRYPTVRFKDAYNNIATSAAVNVAFTVTSGSCSITGGTFTSTDGNGQTELTSSNLTLPATGSCVVRATATGITGSPVDFEIAVGPLSYGNIWLGGTDDDFSHSANWSRGATPTDTSAVFIPLHVPNAPKVRANTGIRTISMETGTTLDLVSTNTLTVNGTVDVTTISHGTVAAVGAASNIKGAFAALTFGDGTSRSCLYTLNGTVTASGNAAISRCGADAGGQTMTIAGNLTVTGLGNEGRLSMHSSSDKVTVSGATTFSGAPTDTSLTDGTLEIGANFSQTATVSALSFAPSGSHTTKLTGTGAQSVNFSNPTSSRFRNLTVTNTTGVTITSIVDVTKDFTMAASAKLSGNSGGGGKRLIVDGAVSAASTADLGGLDSLRVTSNTFPSYANTTAGKAPKMTHLTGSGVALAANGTVAGGLSIDTVSALSIGARTLTVKDSLIVDGSLAMANASGTVIVQGLARFRGGVQTGLQTGNLRVAGDFIEEGGAASFVPAANFLVQLNGAFAQSVRFDHPGSAQSRFAKLEIDNTAANVTFSSDVYITGDLEQKGLLTISSARYAKADGTSSFRSGAQTTVTGSLDLAIANFYSGSSTTGTGTLTVGAGNCSYGLSAVLLVGSFNQTTCSTPGRVLP